ncbi:hypothetical protein M6I34_06220 [Burkholderiaceae bacterium FT117]|uniref:hypothetical protein n=1 Tax=Zeimonas sediminis TaxID=2944268 RepID=UPI002342FC09|nr:hypothetical protein [Zeimonas sediminis]MCM5570097.1 hypothetical protein [Zeimonas sediminis]
MTRALVAGLAYFAAVFAAGFALGIVRTLLVQPLAGATLAVAIELPIIVGFAWFACRVLALRLRVPAGGGHRLAMGGLAFGLLMIAELATSMLLGGRSAAQHLALYREAPHLLGLAGQIAFGLFPWLQGPRKAPAGA